MIGPWVITRQRQTIALDPNTDSYASVIEVTFRTTAGDVASVNVPVADYTVDKVTDTIAQLVAHLNAVRGIEAPA